jgi:peptide/nickel transport system substrate-binding protein
MGGTVRRWSFSRGPRLLVLVVALALLVASCGSSSKKGGGGTNTGPASTGGIIGGNDTGTPVRGGSLTMGIEADTSGGFCLTKAQLAIGGIQVARAIYDTLTQPGGDGKIHPFLAESVTGSNNNQLWTIKLRPNIKFQDGTDLTANVVKDNLDHYRKDNPLFLFVFPDVTSVDVVDNLTLTVKVKRPWSAFPWFLWGSSRLGIMAEAQLNSPNCNTKLIGTGPFECTGSCWKFGDKTTLKRNPNYWGKDEDGNQLPYLDAITLVPQEDGPKRLSSLEAGDFQAIHTSGPKQITKINADVKSGSLKAVESDKFAELSYTMLNTCDKKKPEIPQCGQTSPFSHKSAREAFAYAIDRKVFNHLRNDDLLQNASGPFAPGVPGYLADTGLPGFDPAKAKAAAAQYKQETGKALTFTLNHTADPDTTQDAILLQQMLLQNAGVKISLNSVADQSTLINIAVARTYDATVWRNHPGADDDTQYVWWHCTAPTGTPCDNIINFGGFNDPQINSDLDKARVSSDQAERTRLYEDINRVFAKQLYNLWGQYQLWTVATKPNVHGVLGPKLPDGTAPFEGLATGNPMSRMWCDGGRC